MIVSLAQLANVELQLCMHGLEIKELLRFARCSKRILHAADSPFAWTASAPLCIDVPMPLPTLHSLQSRLLRHAPLSITLQSASLSGEHWMDSVHFAAISGGGHAFPLAIASKRKLSDDMNETAMKKQHVTSDIAAAAAAAAAPAAQQQPSLSPPGAAAAARLLLPPPSARRILAFDATQADLTLGAWMRLLSHPCLHSVQVLRCGRIAAAMRPAVAAAAVAAEHSLASVAAAEKKAAFSAATDSFMRALIARPHLHTLQLEQHDFHSGEYSLLHLMPALTSLSVTDEWPSGEHQQAAARVLLPLTTCAGLKELRVSDMFGDVFAPLLTAPNLRQLRSLTLERFSCGEVLTTPAEFIAVFSALTQLQRLDLIACNSVDFILAHAHLAVSLLFVTLRASARCWCLPDGSDELGPHYRSAMPRPSVIAGLLSQSVSLQTFLITFQAKKWGSNTQRSKELRRGVERHFKRFVDAPELTPFGQRFQMRVELGSLQLDSSKKQPERRGCSVQ